MKPLELDEIVPRERYEALRPDYRLKVIDLKDRRRVAVGDRVTVVFENRETLRFQVQEMCRVERIDDPAAVQHELDTYNELMPPEGGLSATLFIEIPDLAQIRAELDRLIGIDEHVFLDIGDAPVQARFDAKQMEEDRISAVQYIRFDLDADGRRRFADPGVPVALRIDHPSYRHATPLSRRARESLAADLRGEVPVLLTAEQLAGGIPAALDVVEETEDVRVLRVGPRHLLVEPRAPASPPGADADALEAALLRAARRHARALGPEARVEIETAGERPRWHVRG